MTLLRLFKFPVFTITCVLVPVFFSCTTANDKHLSGEWKVIKTSFSNWGEDTTMRPKGPSNQSPFDSARLTLRADSSVDVSGYRLIIPTAEPGFFSTQKLGGSWSVDSGRLSLHIDDRGKDFTFYYKIIKHTRDSLTLGQTNEDYANLLSVIELVSVKPGK